MCSSEGALWAVTIGLSCALLILNVNSQNADKKVFSCEGRPSGYYADIQSGCQIYHMCDGLGRQFSYSCPNTTLFQQRMLICDHWYMVNCSKAELDYGANLLIGQRGKPFVEDDEENPYHRTPRPDLLAHPSAAEYNIIYRTGRAQTGNNKNLVGADSDYDDTKLDQPAYFLPSHWSTEYSKRSTEKPDLKVKAKSKPDFKKSYSPRPEEVTDPPPIVNFQSNYKATTPVYPKIAPTEVPIIEEDYSLNSLKTVLQPPAQNHGYPRIVTPKVNFVSNFKATTPVYPTFVDPEEPLATDEAPAPANSGAYGLSTIIEPPKGPSAPILPVPVLHHKNFDSNYQATTPVYPKHVTTEIPLAIQEYAVDPNQLSLSTVIQPPKSYSENRFNTVQEPSVYYQPPNSPNFEAENEVQTKTIRTFDSENKFKELRRILLIPDGVLPLDASAVRPNYENGPDSFQVNPFSLHVMPRQFASQ